MVYHQQRLWKRIQRLTHLAFCRKPSHRIALSSRWSAGEVEMYWPEKIYKHGVIGAVRKALLPISPELLEHLDCSDWKASSKPRSYCWSIWALKGWAKGIMRKIWFTWCSAQFVWHLGNKGRRCIQFMRISNNETSRSLLSRNREELPSDATGRSLKGEISLLAPLWFTQYICVYMRILAYLRWCSLYVNIFY